MLASDQVEEVICLLATLDRQTLIHEFMAFRSNFPVDMTADYLESLTEDQIRHVFLAMCLQNKRLPEFAMVAA